MNSRAGLIRASAVAVAGLVALSLVACDENRPNPELPIDSVVELRLIQDPPGFLIFARTHRQYGCLGFRIVYDLRSVRLPAAKELVLDLLGVRPPSGYCATALGPAMATVNLGPLSDGEHPLAIAVNDVSVAALLTVTPDSVIVTGGDGPWTVWPEPRIAR